MFDDEVFENVLEQVVVLNPGISLRTWEANIDRNALDGVLVEYNAEKSSHEVRLIPDVMGVSEVVNASNA